MDLSMLESIRFVKSEALELIKKHGCECDLKDFFATCGDKDNYSAIKVYQWLGY